LVTFTVAVYCRAITLKRTPISRCLYFAISAVEHAVLVVAVFITAAVVEKVATLGNVTRVPGIFLAKGALTITVVALFDVALRLAFIRVFHPTLLL